MRIVTWNIGEDERASDGKLSLDSYEYIINIVKNENVDVICLQEAIVKSSYIDSISKYITKNTDLKYSAEFELSDSHINIGCKMGVVICSKYEIKDIKNIALENPKLVHKVNENITYYSHDKGFIKANILGITFLVGHCLPFHIFKKSALDFLEIFEKADEEFIKFYSENDKLLLCGDFNFSNAEKLFPKTMKVCKETIIEPTKNDKQSDHFAISEKLKCTYSKVEENIFDHKFIICDIFESDI